MSKRRIVVVPEHARRINAAMLSISERDHKTRRMGNFFAPGMPVGPRLRKWRAGQIGEKRYGSPRDGA